MSIAKLTKEYRKISKSNSVEYFKRNTYLVTDSKGRCIRRVVPSIGRFHIISEIGANSADERFTDSVVEEIKDKVKPRVIVWFGTCEITQKKGKNISLRTAHM